MTDKKFKIIKANQLRTCQVDISEWVEPGKLVLTEVDVPGTFLAGNDISNFKLRNPEWPDRLCSIVAILGVSHTSPDVGPPGLFYEALVRECPAAFFAVREAFNKAFSSQENIGEAAVEAKNG